MTRRASSQPRTSCVFSFIFVIVSSRRLTPFNLVEEFSRTRDTRCRDASASDVYPDNGSVSQVNRATDVYSRAQLSVSFAAADKVVNPRVCHSNINAALIRPNAVLKFFYD